MTKQGLKSMSSDFKVLYTFLLIPAVLKTTRIKLLFETISRYHANTEISEKKYHLAPLESL